MRPTHPLVLEPLEDRLAPAFAGTPWPDAEHLTLSFAPDGTPAGNTASVLFQTLNARAPTATWQLMALRAFQTWAVNANINFGLVGDQGQPLGAVGLPQVDHRGVTEARWRSDPSAVLASLEPLGLPVFVKPARLGSSVGISKAHDEAELAAAVALAFAHDEKVLVEAAVAGREVECGVLEFPDGRVEASLPAEIRVVAEGSAGWYDFNAKYLDDACEFDIPAKLDDDITAKVRAMAVSAFHALDCQGLARVDFFVGPDGALTVNEVNTMPGFTPISMYPRMWSVTGIDYPALLSTLVETALARGTGLR